MSVAFQEDDVVLTFQIKFMLNIMPIIKIENLDINYIHISLQ